MSNAFQMAKRFVTDPIIRFGYLEKLGLYNSMPDDKFLKKKFRIDAGYELDLEHPQTFNAKLQWLKLHDHNPLYTTMVDKYKAKEYSLSES